MQKVMDLQHELGLSRRRNWIRYAELDECLREADYVSLHVPLLREGESKRPNLAPHQRAHSAADEEERLSCEHLARSGGG